VPPTWSSSLNDGTRHSWTRMRRRRTNDGWRLRLCRYDGASAKTARRFRESSGRPVIGCIAGTGQILSSGCWATTRPSSVVAGKAKVISKANISRTIKPNAGMCPNSGEWKVVTEQATANKP